MRALDSVKKIVTIDSNNHFILKQTSCLVPITIPSKTKEIISYMVEIIKSKGKAAGLAAPQIGFNERIIICCFSGDTEQNLDIMINPTYTRNSDTSEEGWEGCFSIPLTFAKVPRWKNISVSYYTPEGYPITKELTDFAARVYQHELNHLDGILMTDLASEIKKFSTEEEFNDFLQEVRKQRILAAQGNTTKESPKYNLS